jgi:hypothetical protein
MVWPVAELVSSATIYGWPAHPLLAGQLATTEELKACQQPSKTLLGVTFRNTVPGLFAYIYSSLPVCRMIHFHNIDSPQIHQCNSLFRATYNSLPC